MTCHVISARTIPSADLPAAPLRPDQVVAGAPTKRSTPVAALADVEIGIWEHTVGASRDVEVQEVFVVLSGRATVEVEGGPTLEIGPVDLGLLDPGARTIWTVHETLRKVYIVAS